MNTKHFKDLSTGDKLWSFELGSCEVIGIDTDSEIINLHNGTYGCDYDFFGVSKVGRNVNQTLFFRNPINTMDFSE